ncbi:MAG: hypothetical protein JWQ74_3456 [Marmoricola sp.]|nr:hypothetical protein [Marmoricola sp.]
MSPTEATPRPSQVTVAAWAAAIASGLLLVSVFDRVSKLHSVDTRDEVTRALASGSVKGLGISVDEALEVMRWALLVSGVAAVAAAILGIYVLQRNHGARIGLSIAAVPVALTSPFSDSFLGMLVAAATVILWTRPARDWFAGRAPAPATSAPSASAPSAPPLPHAGPQAPPAPAAWVPPSDPAQQPPPMAGWGQPPAGTSPANPFGYYPPASYGAPAPLLPVGNLGPRPRQLRIACILTWVFSSLTGLGYLALLGWIAVDSDGLLKVAKDSPSWDPAFDDDLIITAAVVVGIIFLVWCLSAALLAYLAWRGTSWAWIALVVSTGAAALVSVLAFPYSLPHVIAIAVAFGMLLSRPTRDWFGGHRPR